MIWIEKNRIPEGRWPFLSTARVGLEQIENKLDKDIDLTEGNAGITITGRMRAYRHSVMRRVLDLAQSSIIAWNNGYLIGSIVCARALLETIAIHHSFLMRAEAFAEKSEWKQIGALVDAYAFHTKAGSSKRTKTEYSPPRIGEAIKDFISRTEPGKQEFWDQISDAAHPNGAVMMKYAGTLRDGHYIDRSVSESEPSFFQILFNTLYSCCWLIHSNLDFDILLDVIRSGEILPEDHPLMKKKRLIDEVSVKLSKEMEPMKVGVKVKLKSRQPHH